MAIKPCKECGGPVSDKAESCPQCGAKQKKKTSMLAWIGLILLILAAIGTGLDRSVESNMTSASDSSSNQVISTLEAVPEKKKTGSIRSVKMKCETLSQNLPLQLALIQ